MGFLYFKTFEKDSIADAATYTDAWYPDEDIVIKKIYIVEKSGATLTKSKFYVKVKEAVYTLPVVPASVLGPDVKSTPELNIPVAAKQVVAFTLTNNQGAAISVYITFECWSPA